MYYMYVCMYICIDVCVNVHTVYVWMYVYGPEVNSFLGFPKHFVKILQILVYIQVCRNNLTEYLSCPPADIRFPHAQF
jgi:hypothetical protein